MAIALALVAAAFLAAFWFAPNGVLALRRRAGGELQVDVRFAYGAETLFRLLDAYGAEGRRAFRAMLLLDMIFPAVYAATLYLFGDALGALSPGFALAARSGALAAAAFDYSENLLLLRVLRRYPSRAVTSARLAALCTTSKMIAFATVLAVFAGAFAVAR
jgi:hypothetical protein